MLPIALAIFMLLYVDGFLAQLIGNYARWKQNGGYPGGGTFPAFASLSPAVCLYEVLRFPYGLCGLLVIGALVIVLLLAVWAGRGNRGEYDKDRNFTYSVNGTYGTSGWMGRKEMKGVLELVTDLRHYRGIVLGGLGKKYACVPEKTRLNSNLAVYGASGSMKTRSFCMNRILQGVSRGESLVICDPKSELYEKSSDQDSTFVFIKLVRYADKNCEGGRLPVPAHVLGEELTACGTIPDLSRRLSVIRSRNISMSCVFQNLAGLQNRYPQNLWQEILGNCDVQLF